MFGLYMISEKQADEMHSHHCSETTTLRSNIAKEDEIHQRILIPPHKDHTTNDSLKQSFYINK